MADDPKGDRNVVRFEPNERVDLPDIKALQDNSRSETRLLLHNFVFGHGDMGLMQADGLGWRNIRDRATDTGNPILIIGRPDIQTNFGKNGLCNYIGVEVGPGPTDITVNVAFLEEYQGSSGSALGGGPLTGGFGGTTTDSGDSELGTAVGCEGDDSQTISMPGPDGNYGVYIETVFDPAIPGSVEQRKYVRRRSRNGHTKSCWLELFYSRTLWGSTSRWTAAYRCLQNDGWGCLGLPCVAKQYI